MNTNRILAIDFGRGFSVSLLAVVHTLWMYADLNTQEHSALGHFVHFMGRGTPVFLVTMGVSFMISRNQSMLSAIKRGGIILAAAFFMNFLKFIFPILLGFMPDSFIKAYGWDPSIPLNTGQYWYLLQTGDILQLAGVSLIFMGLIRGLVKNKYIIFLIALLIAAVSREVSGLRLGIEGLDYLLDLLWGSQYNVYFPVFPWLSFILMGMFFGKIYLENNQDQNALFKSMFLWGVLLIAAGAPLVYTNEAYHFNDFFHMGPGGVIYFAGWNFTVISFFHVLVTKLPYNPIFRFYNYCSKHVTSIYIIQWVLICWGMGIFGFQNANQSTVLMLMIVFLTLTFLTRYTIDKILIFFKNRNKKSRLAVG